MKRQPTRNTIPVVLYGTASVALATVAGQPAFSGLVVVPPLVNKYQFPIEIDDLIITVVAETGSAGSAFIPGGASFIDAIDVELRCGSSALTNGPIPAASLNIDRDAFAFVGNSLLGTVGPTESLIRWSFTKPLVMGAAEAINASFANGGIAQVTNTVGGTMTFNVTARGRKRDPVADVVPSPRTLPYAMGVRLLTVGSYPPEKTFQNIYQTPLKIVAVTAYRPLPITGYNFGGGLENLTAGSDGTPGAGIEIGTVQGPGGLAGKNRRTLLEDGSYLARAFGGRGALEIEHVLEPQDFYTLRCTSHPVIFGMLGYREE